MRVLVTSVAPGLDAAIEPRFWHAAYLTVVDTDILECESIEAPHMPNVHTAGTRLGLLATHQQISAAISNDYGPNCYVALDAAGIRMYLSGTCQTVREAVEQLKANKLVTIFQPTVSHVPEPAVTE